MFLTPCNMVILTFELNGGTWSKSCPVLVIIPCSVECKIMGQILIDHALSHAPTVIADVRAVYLQRSLAIKEKLIKSVLSLQSVLHNHGNVTVRGMLISDEFLTDDICATEEYKEFKKVFVGIYIPMIQT
ncbi:hypothetical protein Tco_1459778 [Tanacetum coccineum]